MADITRYHYSQNHTKNYRSLPGLTWDDLELVMSRSTVFETDRDAERPWAGPAGDGWKFWDTVHALRQQQPPRKDADWGAEAMETELLDADLG